MPIPYTRPVLLLAAALCSACASTGAPREAASASATPAAAAQPGAAQLDPKSPDARAVQRWQFIIDGKSELAYDFLSPGVRTTKPRERWAKEIAERPVRWTGVKLVDSACASEDSCKVRVDLTFLVPLQGTPKGVIESHSTIVESWVRVKKSWYFIPDDYASGGLQ